MKNSIKSCILFGSLCLTVVSCGPDWGKMDPPAGNQIYPSLQNVACYNFDEELDPLLVELASHSGGTPAVVAVDDSVQSPVLDISQGAYARLANALQSVVCQTSASVSFWYKQVSGQTLEEGAVAPLNATSSVLHWDMEGSTLDITANGGLKFKSGDKAVNIAPEAANDIVKADKWQFITYVVAQNGYRMFVGGEEVPVVVPEGTDLSEAVGMMNSAEYVTLNNDGDQHMLIDDFTFFRNSATEKEAKQPKKGKIGQTGGGNEGPDYSKWILVGEEDNSTQFWTAWGPYVNLTGDGTIHYEFINYSDEGANWRNWLVCLTNGIERGGDGYSEYMVLRSDAYGWGSIYETGEMSHGFNWDTFCHDMNGAYVNMDINRTGANVEIVCVITTVDGQTFNYRKTIEGVNTDVLGSFLLVEGGHLLIDPESVFVGNVYKPGEYTLGTDTNTGFWSVWSKQVRFESGFKNFAFEFINHSPGEGSSNWQNWGLVVTNGYQSGGDQDPAYHEHYYLRADAYGWGDLYGASAMTHGFDWSTYTSEMKDAHVLMYFTYENQELTMSARQTKADGDRMPEYRFVTPGMPAPISLILTCEGSWLEILKVGYFPFADMSPEEND
ncbi:MAG: hypothetical protein K2K23_07765 [Muribaculaceae bacterium]|nr:hypothetical protein [Muribaculaceae bacterium]